MIGRSTRNVVGWRKIKMDVKKQNKTTTRIAGSFLKNFILSPLYCPCLFVG